MPYVYLVVSLKLAQFHLDMPYIFKVHCSESVPGMCNNYQARWLHQGLINSTLCRS